MAGIAAAAWFDETGGKTIAVAAAESEITGAPSTSPLELHSGGPPLAFKLQLHDHDRICAQLR